MVNQGLLAHSPEETGHGCITASWSRYFPPCVLIELVKVPIIDTTKVRVRWFPQLEGDPRRCDFSESLDIARELLDEHLNGSLDPRNRELLPTLLPVFHPSI